MQPMHQEQSLRRVFFKVLDYESLSVCVVLGFRFNFCLQQLSLPSRVCMFWLFRKPLKIIQAWFGTGAPANHVVGTGLQRIGGHPSQA
jgi:hypothetical protein